MTTGAGVVRSSRSLELAAAVVEEVSDHLSGRPQENRPGPMTAGVGELVNLLTLCHAVLGSAAQRHESRGAHLREEFPHRVPEWRCRIVYGADGRRPGPSSELAG
jgi:succinate dehydrogenase/fumarate reductase flavoprotein subunit